MTPRDIMRSRPATGRNPDDRRLALPAPDRQDQDHQQREQQSGLHKTLLCSLTRPAHSGRAVCILGGGR